MKGCSDVHKLVVRQVLIASVVNRNRMIRTIIQHPALSCVGQFTEVAQAPGPAELAHHS